VTGSSNTDREAAVHMGEFIGDKHLISIEPGR
jgi:hypothetical protein